MAFQLKTALALGAMVVAAAPGALAQPIGTPAPATVQPDEDEGLQYAASVAQVNSLTHQGDLSPTLFSTVGDTAINGVYVFLSFDGPPDVGARIFRIADLSDYRIVSETRGRLLLAVTKEEIGAGGDPVRRRGRVLVTWTPGPDGTPPASVTVATAPAR